MRTLFVLLCLISFFCAAETPDIGLVYTQEQFQKVEQGKSDPLTLYRTAIEDNGGKVIVLSPAIPEDENRKRIETLEGILLPGGGDIDPSFYGDTSHGKLERVDNTLDRFELNLLRHAQETALPVLGICRGHQLINVYYQGTMYQDLPSEFPAGAKKTVSHRGKGVRHEIIIDPASTLHELLGTDRITVNSLHHQAVKQLGKGLRVSARSEDGVVEGIEQENGGFVLGVQFHPEKLRGGDPRMNALFLRFIAEVGKKQPAATP